MRSLNEHVREVRAFAPASVTNVSCGFDVLGFALDRPGDEVVVRWKKQGPLRISRVVGNANSIPTEVERNTSGAAILAFVKTVGLDDHFEIEIHKKMAIGTGLGSSAASAVAGVLAVNQFLERPLSKAELLPFALEGERITSGGDVHADNVAAALLGGFIAVRSVQPVDIIPLHYPTQLACTVVHPHIELPTAEMRRILREQISLHDAVRQWGNIAAFVAGLQNEDLEVMRRSLNDVIIEPVRGKVIPGYEQAKEAALKSGALGSGISGSGPSIFALCDSQEVAQKAGQAMQRVFDELQIQSDVYVSQVNARGAEILEVKMKTGKKEKGKMKKEAV